jgi:hypothetical protein
VAGHVQDAVLVSDTAPLTVQRARRQHEAAVLGPAPGQADGRSPDFRALQRGRTAER